MRLLKRLLSITFLLIIAGSAAFAVLYQKGYFEDPQVALRELEKRAIAPTPASVHRAASEGQTEVLKLLSRAEADFQTPDSKGRSPLHLALAKKHVTLLETIESEGCNLDARDAEGNTPLSLALGHDLHDLAARFVSLGASPNFTLPSGELGLPGYFRAKQIDNFRFLLENGANPDSPALDGQSLLALALQDKQPTLACKLLNAGADANSAILGEPALASVLLHFPEWGLEPAEAGRVVGTLLVSGADAEKPTSEGTRPLQIALASDFRPALELILPRVANVQGCLWIAIEQQNVAAIQNLFDKGVSPDEIGPGGESPLIHAIRNDDVDLLKSLLSAGADPNQFCPEGQRAFYFALATSHPDCALAMLRHRNRPNLDLVMEDPVSEEFRDLFRRKGLFDWYCRNETGLNPLMAAVMLRELAVAEELLALDFDRYKGTTNGVYPIQMAAANGDVKMQQLLIGVSYRDEDQERTFLIDLSEQRVTYYKNGAVEKTSRISSGMSGFRTPTGAYVITDKARHKKSNIYNEAEMPYFQRFSCKAIGFHEGNTGSPFASHGCIRLPRDTAKYFWGQTKIGDRVTIQD